MGNRNGADTNRFVISRGNLNKISMAKLNVIFFKPSSLKTFRPALPPGDGKGDLLMDKLEQSKESVKSALAALETETREVVQASKRLNENLIEAVSRTWRQLLLIWFVVIALAVSYFLVLSKAPQTFRGADIQPDAGLKPETSTTLPVAPPGDIFPAIPERDELVKVLKQIREAQYKKDIALFLQAYAPTFPDLNRKRDQTLDIWRRFDYLNLQFHVTDIHRQDPETITATVNWDIKARDRKTDTVKTLPKSYQVQFSKASGQWLIQRLDAVDGEDTKDKHSG